VNLAFLGTSAFACPALRAVDRAYGIDLVVTQPDRPVGRHAQLTPSAVKQLALELNLPLSQPANINDPESVARLRSLSLDAIVVASYGQLLKPGVFKAARWGAVNIHASLLPAYRGAAPVQWAIIQGETRTGVSTFFIEKGLDTGDVLMDAATEIGPDETAAEVEERLAQLGASLIVDTLDAFVGGTARPVPQPTDGVSLAPSLTREDGRIDWRQPAARIHNLVRGTVPWPGAWTQLDGKRVKIHRTRRTSFESGVVTPGETGAASTNRLLVGTGSRLLEILELQREGKGQTSGAEFLHGLNGPARFT
jgi:methionyl-tRNA formyltransferase